MSDGIVRFGFEGDKISISVIRVVDGIPREATALIDGCTAKSFAGTLDLLGDFKIDEARDHANRNCAALAQILSIDGQDKRTA